VLQANPASEADPEIRLFAKWGLMVRYGVAVDLQIGSGWAGRAWIGWNNARPVTVFHVPACPAPSGGDQWFGLPGGTWVAEPSCVPLIVRAHDEQTQVNIAVGEACET
jgi:hypothetical protein